MTDINLCPYPHALRAEPDTNLLAKQDLSIIIEKYGSLWLMAGRFPEKIVYTSVPPEIMNFRECGSYLVVLDSGDLPTYGIFSDIEDANKFSNMREVLVCAPPLSGPQAFCIAKLAWKEALLLETTIATLESLDMVSGWTAQRAESAIAELFVSLESEAADWHKMSEGYCGIEYSNKKWSQLLSFYSPQFDNLAEIIKKFIRNFTIIFYSSIPDADPCLVNGLTKIASYGLCHNEIDIVNKTYRILMRHPKTILGVLRSPCLKTAVDHPVLGLQTLRRIYDEEAATIAELDNKTLDLGPSSAGNCKKFVFYLSAAYDLAVHALKAPVSLHAPETAQKNLNVFLGGYLDDLDLSQSFITGSAAMSSVLRCDQIYSRYTMHSGFLESYYPSVYSKVAPDSILALYNLGKQTWTTKPYTFLVADVRPSDFSLSSDNGAPRAFKEMRWFAGLPNEVVIPFEVVQGVDVNIAIAAVGKEFDRIAHSHYEAIKRRFPSAILVALSPTNSPAGRETARTYRVVSSKAPGLEKGFRVVEMYPSSWTDICKSNVGMIRLAYTAARLDGTAASLPKFYMSASCVQSAIESSTPDYYHRESQKRSPQELLLKYARRGYPPKFLPEVVQRALFAYIENAPRWNPSGSTRLRNCWTTFADNPPTRAVAGDFNLANYAVESRAFGYGKLTLI